VRRHDHVPVAFPDNASSPPVSANTAHKLIVEQAITTKHITANHGTGFSVTTAAEKSAPTVQSGVWYVHIDVSY